MKHDHAQVKYKVLLAADSVISKTVSERKNNKTKILHNNNNKGKCSKVIRFDCHLIKYKTLMFVDQKKNLFLKQCGIKKRFTALISMPKRLM